MPYNPFEDYIKMKDVSGQLKPSDRLTPNWGNIAAVGAPLAASLLSAFLPGRKPQEPRYWAQPEKMGPDLGQRLGQWVQGATGYGQELVKGFTVQKALKDQQKQQEFENMIEQMTTQADVEATQAGTRKDLATAGKTERETELLGKTTEKEQAEIRKADAMTRYYNAQSQKVLGELSGAGIDIKDENKLLGKLKGQTAPRLGNEMINLFNQAQAGNPQAREWFLNFDARLLDAGPELEKETITYLDDWGRKRTEKASNLVGILYQMHSSLKSKLGTSQGGGTPGTPDLQNVEQTIPQGQGGLFTPTPGMGEGTQLPSIGPGQAGLGEGTMMGDPRKELEYYVNLSQTERVQMSSELAKQVVDKITEILKANPELVSYAQGLGVQVTIQ